MRRLIRNDATSTPSFSAGSEQSPIIGPPPMIDKLERVVNKIVEFATWN
jgi:hypothetical protein